MTAEQKERYLPHQRKAARAAKRKMMTDATARIERNIRHSKRLQEIAAQKREAEVRRLATEEL